MKLPNSLYRDLCKFVVPVLRDPEYYNLLRGRRMLIFRGIMANRGDDPELTRGIIVAIIGRGGRYVHFKIIDHCDLIVEYEVKQRHKVRHENLSL
jgi:hypothetical protein